MTEVRWGKLRRDEIGAAAAAGATLLLPTGAVEQHGPHLPLDTDIVDANAVAERAARLLTDPPALVLPPIWWGLSPYWLSFPGTLTLRPETMLALVSDIGASAAHHGFQRVAIVNGHGGNAGLVGVAATQLAEHGLRAVALSYWDLLGEDLGRIAPGDAGHIGHAGQTETSIQLYLQPERVREPLPGPEGCADLTARMAEPFARVGYAPPDPAREAPLGVYGAAAAARPEIGKELIALAAERLAEFIRRFVAAST
ncbi:MAG: creatininase family protein [Thermomicrobiales bacterium]|nr:creatininase family protein [Thermomicrobiales bacterium]